LLFLCRFKCAAGSHLRVLRPDSLCDSTEGILSEAASAPPLDWYVLYTAVSF
jgi:hypothetical protein